MTHSEDQDPIAPCLPADAKAQSADRTATAETPAERVREIGGREGPDPTRFGDWELRGRCIDF